MAAITATAIAALVQGDDDEAVDELEEKLDQLMTECAIHAEQTINRRSLGGRRLTVEQCNETVGKDEDGQPVTRAMALGKEKHAEAFGCIKAKLETLIPGYFLIEQRYRYDKARGNPLRRPRPGSLRLRLQVPLPGDQKGEVVSLQTRPLQGSHPREHLLGRIWRKTWSCLPLGGVAMSERYPRIRRYLENGNLALREGLHLCFFMKRSHGEISTAVARALDLYLHTVGRDKLGWYVDPEGECQPLGDKGWEYVRYVLFDTAQSEGCSLTLLDHPAHVSGFQFELSGSNLASDFAVRRPGLVSGVSFWLPTEYLEEQGPGQVRELAVAQARELPLVSGYASLSFNHIEVLWADRLIRELCLQYPGLDVHALEGTVMSIGTGVRGPYWLNFYGQPLLERLGGAEGLRARLPLPTIDVQELGQDKVLVALGEWPIAGNEEQPEALRPYRELSRVLEPHLHEECVRWRSLNPTRMRQWQRRFLG